MLSSVCSRDPNAQRAQRPRVQRAIRKTLMTRTLALLVPSGTASPSSTTRIW